MELYLFFWGMLAWSITVSVLGWVVFPWAALSYKIWHGNKPIDEELREELLTRSWSAGWRLGIAAIVLLVLDYATVEWLALPSGPIHMVYYLIFLSFASWVMRYCFALEDFIQGLILAMIYLYIPTAVLFFFRHWNPLYRYVLSWLSEPK